MIHDLSISILNTRYQQAELTPAELLKTLRQQMIEQADYHAWITILSESDLDQYINGLTDKSPATHPLYGIPFAIKDNIDLAGMPTTAACPAYSYTPETSAPVVQLLIEAGAIPMGKTNLDQFATGLVGTRSPFGEGINTFQPDYISGGSSAGSAIATALGQVSFALGTDTAGSGRVPAVFNNLIGHKPTKGLLSTRGVVPACRSLDCVSLFTLNAEDAAKVWDVVAIYDDQDPYARKNRPHNLSRYFAPETDTFTFGIPEHLAAESDESVGNHHEIETLFFDSIKALEALGGTAVPLPFDDFLAAARLLYEGQWVAERWVATQDVKPEDMLPVIEQIIKPADSLLAADLFKAQYKLQALKKRCDALVEQVDFIVAPTTPAIYTREQVAHDPIGLNAKLGTYTNFMNLLDYAATAVPTGMTQVGVPWGVTLFSTPHSDIQLLSYAALLHQHCMKTQGATPHSIVKTKHAIQLTNSGIACHAKTIDVVVCGAHLSGQPLNWQLTERGATHIASPRSAPCYELYALSDGKRPAMVRNEAANSPIEVEVWRMPSEHFGSFVAGIPAPLGIGKVELEDGRWLSGFICENGGIKDAKNISHYGGWRAWLAKKD